MLTTVELLVIISGLAALGVAIYAIKRGQKTAKKNENTSETKGISEKRLDPS
jgi:hypothetical protein